jgi:hypothetical protein
MAGAVGRLDGAPAGSKQELGRWLKRRLLVDHRSRTRYGSSTEIQSDVSSAYVGKPGGAVDNRSSPLALQPSG